MQVHVSAETDSKKEKTKPEFLDINLWYITQWLSKISLYI